MKYALHWAELSATEPTPGELAQHAPALSAAYNEPRNAELLGHTFTISAAEVIENYRDAIADGMRAFFLFERGTLAGDGDLRGIRGNTAEFAFMIAVPAAFTKQTGEAHWHVLLRARAIETGAFVLAAAQGGLHENGRSTYGHSMIVSPWGEVLAEAGEDPQILLADIDLGLSAEARAKIPSLKHGREFEVEIGGAKAKPQGEVK